MSRIIPASGIIMWNKVKADPKKWKRPPFPPVGKVEITACARPVPICIEWDTAKETLTIDGKSVRVLFDRGWAFKVRREGIYTAHHTDGLMYDLLSECVNNGPLDTMYYNMLTKAKKICTKAA